METLRTITQLIQSRDAMWNHACAITKERDTWRIWMHQSLLIPGNRAKVPVSTTVSNAATA